MSFLKIEQVRKRFGAVETIKGVSFEAAKGEFVVFVGPSGCGKSTLLRMISGLEETSDGRILIDGEDLTHADPAERHVAMVFQSYALFPHMSVYDNIAFGMQINKVPKAEIQARVMEAARILQIEPLLARRPKQLSGGQRQRVAIGRAIVRKPKLFLFDEPLSNLDAELRTQMRVEIAKLHREIGATMIYVTHDQVEAMTLADRIVVLRNGEVEQVGSPTELYDNPANLFVAGFIGNPRMSFLDGVVESVSGGAARIASPAFAEPQTISGPFVRTLVPGESVTLGLRPEALHIDAGAPVLTAKVEITENLGGSTLIHARTSDGRALTLATPDRAAAREGSLLPLAFAAAPHLFGADGKRLSAPIG
ncbi:ABC transporter ATP-binding protein [Aureimonas ureilytica]|uniref:ABC transporter ATP-binding protein n=1 Tax=Aureimonas ureilytica TaxID=401562 RepID=A0A175RW47_9HYPH|nr:sn-glycerol-3-phosphate ABC transporter ATP-binding protein UgpC [Aureimonas ureilytica]KTR07866.1 ABC transporter ATP-binding protein [Aureimonas ureilytica]